jgi:dTDP-4-dehydrorhamnose reductase
MVSVLSGGILITGGSGQLGRSLQVEAAVRGLNFAAVSRPQFDFERKESLTACLETARPGLVVNAAAYTAVDAAERNQAAARAGNHTGPLRLAELCAARDIPLIHVSTDYVFDGRKGAPYVEDDKTAPAGVYGATKRDGEVAILATDARAIILRTAWVYAAHGKNFARTMLGAARKTNALRVVADQRGTPTAAVDLATAILQIAARLQVQGWRDDYRGIYHATGTGETTWYGFANAIFAAAEVFGLQRPVVTPITTAEWPTPAKRPADSRLDCRKLERVFGCRLPDWRDTLPKIVADLWALDAPC